MRAGHSQKRGRRAAVLAAGLACLNVSGCGDGEQGSACPTDASLPGVRTGQPPWPAELDQLGERLDRIGLPRLTQEGRAMDLHVQLSVKVEGATVTVPSSIGLNGQEVDGGRMVTGFVSAIHTHDDTGLVHVHSPDVRPYTLGHLFDVWGVALSRTQLGGSCAGTGGVLAVEANGRHVNDDPRELELEQDQQITVTFGRA